MAAPQHTVCLVVILFTAFGFTSCIFKDTDNAPLLTTAPASTKGYTYTWSDFGINEYVLTGRWNDQTYRAVIWLRVLCTRDPKQHLARFVITLNHADQAQLDSKKFHAVLPRSFLNSESRLPDLHLHPEFNGSDVTVEQQYWKELIETEWRSNAHVGQASVDSDNLYILGMEGSELTFPISTYHCSKAHDLFWGMPVWIGNVEKVLKKQHPELHQFLVMQHLQYHLKLGVQGMLLVCAQETAARLLSNNTIKAAVQARQLVLIVWEGALIRRYHRLLIEVPAHNLLQLAMANSDALLGLWDLDEYLVLPKRRSITFEVKDGCMRGLHDHIRTPEQVLRFTLAHDTSSATPDIEKWYQYGGMVEAAKHMNYTIQPYKHCDHGIYCKAIINPNSNHTMHVHQLVVQGSASRKPTDSDCAYILHFWNLLSVHMFWDPVILDLDRPMDISSLPQ